MLTHSELIHFNASYKSKGDFLADLSCELRTPYLNCEQRLFPYGDKLSKSEKLCQEKKIPEFQHRGQDSRGVAPDPAALAFPIERKCVIIEQQE